MGRAPDNEEGIVEPDEGGDQHENILMLMEVQDEQIGRLGIQKNPEIYHMWKVKEEVEFIGSSPHSADTCSHPLSSQSILMKSLLDVLHKHGPSMPKLEENPLCSNVSLALESIITSISGLNIANFPYSSPEFPLPSAKPSKKPHYNFCPRDKKYFPSEAVGGLGIIQESSIPPKTRGRKSNISKSHIKAKLDIADRKQLSLKGALRAAHASVVVTK